MSGQIRNAVGVGQPGTQQYVLHVGATEAEMIAVAQLGQGGCNVALGDFDAVNLHATSLWRTIQTAGNKRSTIKGRAIA